MNKFRKKTIFDRNYFEVLLVVSSWQNSDFHSHFSMSKIISIFLIFFVEEYHFRSTFLSSTFFENFDFWNTLFSKNFSQLRRSSRYHTCTIITRSWFETAFGYKLQRAKFPCLVHKLSVILTALDSKPH